MTSEDSSSAVRPVLVYFVAVGSFSLTPLIVASSDDRAHPLVFFGIWQLMQGVCLYGYFRFREAWRRGHIEHPADSDKASSSAVHERNGLAQALRSRALSSLRSRPLYTGLITLMILLTPFNWLLFERGVRFSGSVVATALFEVHPTVVIVLLSLLPTYVTGTNRSRQSISTDWLLILCAGVGVVLVAMSQAEHVSAAAISRGLVWGLSGAILLAIDVTLVLRVPYWLGFGQESVDVRDRVGLVVVFVQKILCGTTVLMIAVGVVTFGDAEVIGGPWLPLLGGLIHAVGWSCFARANHALADMPAVNSLNNLTPLLALVWLGLFSTVTLVRVDWFVLGALVIITANTLLHLDPEGARRSVNQQEHDRKARGWGYRSLVVSILVSGSFMLFRNELTPESWHRWNLPEYWGMLALCATVFVLILSFRVSRVAERTLSEDTLMLQIFREAEHHVRTGVFKAENIDGAPRNILTELRALNRKREAHEIRDHYLTAREIVTRAADRHWDENATAEHRGDGSGLGRELQIFQCSLDQLTNLRQTGRGFAEMVSLVLFGTVTVFIALLLRPSIATGESASWEGFAVEMIGMVVAAAVAFLVFSLFDRQGERDSSILRADSESRLGTETGESHAAPQSQAGRTGWQLHIFVDRDLTWERRVSAVVLIGVLSTMTWLLYDKWI